MAPISCWTFHVYEGARAPKTARGAAGTPPPISPAAPGCDHVRGDAQLFIQRRASRARGIARRHDQVLGISGVSAGAKHGKGRGLQVSPLLSISNND